MDPTSVNPKVISHSGLPPIAKKERPSVIEKSEETRSMTGKVTAENFDPYIQVALTGFDNIIDVVLGKLTNAPEAKVRVTGIKSVVGQLGKKAQKLKANVAEKLLNKFKPELRNSLENTLNRAIENLIKRAEAKKGSPLDKDQAQVEIIDFIASQMNHIIIPLLEELQYLDPQNDKKKIHEKITLLQKELLGLLFPNGAKDLIIDTTGLPVTSKFVANLIWDQIEKKSFLYLEKFLMGSLGAVQKMNKEPGYTQFNKVTERLLGNVDQLIPDLLKKEGELLRSAEWRSNASEVELMVRDLATKLGKSDKGEFPELFKNIGIVLRQLIPIVLVGQMKHKKDPNQNLIPFLIGRVVGAFDRFDKQRKAQFTEMVKNFNQQVKTITSNYANPNDPRCLSEIEVLERKLHSFIIPEIDELLTDLGLDVNGLSRILPQGGPAIARALHEQISIVLVDFFRNVVLPFRELPPLPDIPEVHVLQSLFREQAVKPLLKKYDLTSILGEDESQELFQMGERYGMHILVQCLKRLNGGKETNMIAGAFERMMSMVDRHLVKDELVKQLAAWKAMPDVTGEEYDAKMKRKKEIIQLYFSPITTQLLNESGLLEPDVALMPDLLRRTAMKSTNDMLQELCFNQSLNFLFLNVPVERESDVGKLTLGLMSQLKPRIQETLKKFASKLPKLGDDYLPGVSETDKSLFFEQMKALLIGNQTLQNWVSSILERVLYKGLANFKEYLKEKAIESTGDLMTDLVVFLESVLKEVPIPRETLKAYKKIMNIKAALIKENNFDEQNFLETYGPQLKTIRKQMQAHLQGPVSKILNAFGYHSKEDLPVPIAYQERVWNMLHEELLPNLALDTMLKFTQTQKALKKHREEAFTHLEPNKFSRLIDATKKYAKYIVAQGQKVLLQEALSTPDIPETTPSPLKKQIEQIGADPATLLTNAALMVPTVEQTVSDMLLIVYSRATERLEEIEKNNPQAVYAFAIDMIGLFASKLSGGSKKYQAQMKPVEYANFTDYLLKLMKFESKDDLDFIPEEFREEAYKMLQSFIAEKLQTSVQKLATEENVTDILVNIVKKVNHKLDEKIAALDRPKAKTKEKTPKIHRIKPTQSDEQVREAREKIRNIMLNLSKILPGSLKNITTLMDRLDLLPVDEVEEVLRSSLGSLKLSNLVEKGFLSSIPDIEDVAVSAPKIPKSLEELKNEYQEEINKAWEKAQTLTIKSLNSYWWGGLVRFMFKPVEKLIFRSIRRRIIDGQSENIRRAIVDNPFGVSSLKEVFGLIQERFPIASSSTG